MDSIPNLWSSLNDTYKGIILGGIIGLASGLIGSWYSANRNWKQEKYFKLQSISEEIVNYLRKLQKYKALYEQKREELKQYSDLLQGGSSYGDQMYNQWHMERYESICKQLDEIGNLKQDFHDAVFSKIQIYFSEFGLTKIRDKSIELSRAINNPEGTDEEISRLCVELKDIIIITVKRYGRNWFKNALCYFIEKYN